VISSFSRAIPANGLNAEPVDARQCEQWQLLAYSNSSGTVNVTAPQSQPPLSLTSPPP
jgi:hypothetical protein